MTRTWIASLALCGTGAPAVAQIPQEIADGIEKALPDKAWAAPKQARTLLVFSRTTGFRHSSIPVGAHALRRLGEKTQAWKVENSEDPAVFSAERLKAFDGVLFLNTTGAPLAEESQRQALLDFVAGGKGVAGIHAASDAHYDWPEYGLLIGGYFDGHPWHERVAVKVEGRDHPLNKAFDGDRFDIVDEIYQFKAEPYSRERLRVLLSLDVAATDMKKEGIHRTDGDFAVAWIHAHGKGRVFYCSLGHREDIYTHPAILRHYLAGIQYALGDLEADATPSRKPAAAASGAGR